MFADSLLESGVHRPSRRRSLSLLTSLALEALAIAVLIAIPLWHPDLLAAAAPRVIYAVPLEDYAVQPGPLHPARGGGGGHTPLGIAPVFHASNHTLYAGPSAVNSNDESPICATCPIGPYVGPATGLQLFTNVQPLPPPTHRAPPLRVSHYDPGSIVRQVLPVYPDLARRVGVQGDVVLQAVITREGTIAQLTVVRGHPLLAPAALEAVRQWRFRPYVLNGQPIAIETTITVNFRLDGGGGAL